MTSFSHGSLTLRMSHDDQNMALLARGGYDLRVALVATSRILQDSVFEPVLFKVFINNSSKYLEVILSKFVDDSKLGRVMTPLRIERPCTRILTNLWVVSICLKKSKCWLLHLDWDSPGSMYIPGNVGLESSLMGRDLGALSGSKLNMSQQCALAAQRANSTLEGTRPSAAARRRGRGCLLCAVLCSLICVGYS